MSSSSEQRGFPYHESYEDYAGIQHHFVIEQDHILTAGHMVTAKEKEKEWGYEFSAYSPVSPFEALGRVREKIRKNLSTRYVKTRKMGPEFTHNEARGRITHLGLVINGELLPFETISTMLCTFEGWDGNPPFFEANQKRS